MKKPSSGTLVGLLIALAALASLVTNLLQPVKTVPKEGVDLPPHLRSE